MYPNIISLESSETEGLWTYEWTCYVDEDIDGCGADGKLLVGDRRRGHYQGGRKVGLVITETALSCLRANLQTDKCG